MEKIAAAAIKIGDQVFTGTTHFGAMREIAQSLPADQVATAMLDGEDGFLTTDGRFVDRAEAFEIAQASRQISSVQGLDDPEKNKAFYGTEKPSLDSGIVESYAPMSVVRA